MSDSVPVPFTTDGANPQAILEHRLLELEQEKHDLQLMLDMAIEHSDTLLDSLRRQNSELTQQLAPGLTPAAASTDVGNARQSQLGEEFQLMAKVLPIGLMIARIADGRIVYGNLATCQLLGLSAEQLGKRKITDFCHGFENSQQLVSAMLTQQPLRRELRWSLPNGRAVEATVSLQPFRFRNEQAVLTVIQAVTA